MQFKLIQDIVSRLISSIENSAIASTRTLSRNTFDVKVNNFKKVQDVKGTVIVGNQKKLESELKKANKIQKSIVEWLNKYKAPEEIRVSNFPEPIKIPKTVSVDNFPEQLPFPKNIRVTNQPTQELKDLLSELESVKKSIDKLKLDPKINVEAPQRETIIIPAPEVNVSKEEIDYKKMAKAISGIVPDIDYKRLEKIFKENQKEFVTVGGGGSSSQFKKSDGTPSRALIDGSDRLVVYLDNTEDIKPTNYRVKSALSGNYIYVGYALPNQLTSAAAWRIKRVDTSTPADDVEWADGDDNFDNIWLNYASLTYGPSESAGAGELFSFMDGEQFTFMDGTDYNYM